MKKTLRGQQQWILVGCKKDKVNKMNTRIEMINKSAYCAYCGKELTNPNFLIQPEPILTCNCEKAKEELDLYNKLKELYNTPLAESLIEKKVQKYRNDLLGIKE